MGSKRNKILGKVVGAIADLGYASSSKRILESIRENPQNEIFTDDDFQLAIKRGEFEGVLQKLKSGKYRIGNLGSQGYFYPENETDSTGRRRGSRRGKSRKRSRSRSGHRRGSSRRRRRSSSRRRRG